MKWQNHYKQISEEDKVRTSIMVRGGAICGPDRVMAQPRKILFCLDCAIHVYQSL
jgi:hypothetical protein